MIFSCLEVAIFVRHFIIQLKAKYPQAVLFKAKCHQVL